MQENAKIQRYDVIGILTQYLSERGVLRGKSDRSWCDGSSDRSIQCSMTGVTKAVVCVILSMG